MGERYILSIDCGTQSIRALLFDEYGDMAAKEKAEFEPYFSDYPGWAEQEAEMYYSSLCRVCGGLKEKQPGKWDKIIGVTVTTQRDTCVNIDKDGKVLRPAITWLDQRMARCDKPLPVLDNAMFKCIGMRKAVEISRRKSRSNWIKENQPEIWEATYKYMLLSGYLTYRLTGEMKDSIANQIGHIPFDYKNKSWPKYANSWRWHVFGIEKEKLPELVEPGQIIGGITAAASAGTGLKEGLPVIAGGSDKGCETLGSGCLGLDCASLSFGTTATIQTTSSFYFEPIRFMPAYPSAIPGHYNPEIEIFRGYWMISWFKKEFSTRELLEAKERNIPPEVLLNERLNDIPPGSHGLILQPYWGPGLKMPDAKGSIIGFGDVHTRAHIYRAIIEGINYALYEGLELIERKSGTRVRRIMVSGGGSQSDTICQITADMFNRPVCKGVTYETSGLGAAIIGFVGLGVYGSYREAVDKMVRSSVIYQPDKNSAEIYSKLYNRVYKKIYSKLKDLYSEIKEITNYPEI